MNLWFYKIVKKGSQWWQPVLKLEVFFWKNSIANFGIQYFKPKKLETLGSKTMVMNAQSLYASDRLMFYSKTEKEQVISNISNLVKWKK